MAKSTKKKSTAQPGGASENLLEKRSRKALRKPSAKRKKSRVAKPLAAVSETDAAVLDRLFAVVESRRDADPSVSHSARLLSRGAAKVAQKFGEEAVECLIDAVAGNRDGLVGESADVLYHLLVLWVSSGVRPAEVWAELIRREGISGIAEKAARAKPAAVRRRLDTSKIP
jgi:phosphoribosyl-ATP pyrophosphohydrolase